MGWAQCRSFNGSGKKSSGRTATHVSMSLLHSSGIPRYPSPQSTASPTGMLYGSVSLRQAVEARSALGSIPPRRGATCGGNGGGGGGGVQGCLA